MATVSG